MMKGLLHITAIITVLLVSCKNANEKEPKSEKHGGELIIGTTVPLNKKYIFGPTFVSESAYLYIMYHEFEGLTRINPNNNNLEPSLAKSWEILNEGKEFIFHLRSDVTFSNPGERIPFNAYNVKKCFDSACYPDGNVAFAKLKDVIDGMEDFRKSIKAGSPNEGGVKGVQVIDDSTVRFVLQKKYVPFPQLLSDPNIYVYVTVDDIFYGTGPFKFDRIENNVLTLHRNNYYWKLDEEGYRLPYLDSLKIAAGVLDNPPKIIKVPLEDRLNKFLIDSLHIIRSIKTEDIATVMRVLREENDVEFEYESIDYARLSAISINNYAKPFNDYRVRKAFELAFDANLFVDSVLNGEGWPANSGFMPPGLINYSEEVINREKNIKEAKRLLAEAGYSNLNAFPVVEMSAVYYDGAENSATQSFNQAIEMICKNLGVRYKLKRYESYGALFANNYTGDYMLCPFIYTSKIPSPEGYLNIFALKVDTTRELVEHDNIMFFRDSLFDNDYFDALKQVDEEERLKKFLSAERRMLSKSPIIPLCYSEINRIVSKKIKGLSEINNLAIEDYTYTYFAK